MTLNCKYNDDEIKHKLNNIRNNFLVWKEMWNIQMSHRNELENETNLSFIHNEKLYILYKYDERWADSSFKFI